jgi:hypothetical protein
MNQAARLRDVMRAQSRFVVGAVVIAFVSAFGLAAQRNNVFSVSREHPAIAYSTRPGDNPATQLNDALQRGTKQLRFESGHGYLRSLLDALKVPAESQVLVFSETSAQARLISPQHPRALFFNDAVAVGWVPGADLLEIAAHDARQGVFFYTLEQKRASAPQLKREISCLLCHLSWDTSAVPGMLTLSTFPMSDDKNAYADGVIVDHRTPLAERWGGWYVTGRSLPARHLGNVPVIRPAAQLAKPTAPPPRFSSMSGSLGAATEYLSPYSDVVALMVLAHQTQAVNLLTWVGWEARVALEANPPRLERVEQAVRDLVDYFLFVDEAPIPGRIEGSSGFAETFAATGPRDGAGRSFRQLDLTTRLMRYPCSYMIYSEAFDALPGVAREQVYARLWHILSGQELDRRYARLSMNDRRAIVEILRATKSDLPRTFQVSDIR